MSRRAVSRRHGHRVREPRLTAAVQFWPRADLELARELWPNLFDDGLPEDYWTTVERNLREAAERLELLLVPVRVRELREHLARTGADVDEEAARQAYAEERVALEDVYAWPPPTDGACWCESGAAYGRCCGLT